MTSAIEADWRRLLEEAAERCRRYLEEIGERRVAPSRETVEAVAGLAGRLPEEPCDPAQVLGRLDELGSPATVANAGRRFFGFVNGGSLPATVAAGWLAAAWDQNAGLAAASPLAARLEEIVLAWVAELLGLPEGTAGGLVTGCTMANFCGLAAGRHHLLGQAGWDVEARGLFGAPELRVVVGAEVHVSLVKALGMLGLGRERVERVPVDEQGRMRAEELPPLDERTLLCLQAGNVNTGAIDPLGPLCDAARQAGAWVHVDGAFGLWAAAAPERAALVAGHERADSWATDFHKWLNVPYESGAVFCRHPEALTGAFRMGASYLEWGSGREPNHFVPEMSRRAHAIEVWAALASLGRRGVAELVERCCRLAARFAAALEQAGFDILNEVTLNQVLVSFGSAAATRRVVAAVQEEGTCWCGATEWQGRTAMRISVINWATTEEDVDRSVAAIVRCAEGVVGEG